MSTKRRKPGVASPLIAAVDLFCGVGGLTHGLELAGVHVQAGYDLDPACEYPYTANNGASFYMSDVELINGQDIAPYLANGKFSLIAGCAPCQPFSRMSQPARKAGKRTESWHLVEEFGRIIAAASPDFITMENVAELARHSVFDAFLKRLAGYRVAWSIIDLSKIGVPQSRKRLVLVASKHGAVSLPGSTNFLRTATVRGVIESLPPIAAGEADPTDALHVAPRLSEKNLNRIKSSQPGGTWRDWKESLRADCHRADSGATYPSIYGRMEWDRGAPTITTQFYGYGSGRFGHPEQDRAISLREGAMLQTFPQTYKFVQSGERVRFNTLGRLIGNAVPVRLGQVVGEILMQHAANL